MHLLDGGLPVAGEAVLVQGKRATVVCSAFVTFVFRGDVSVRFEDGRLDLVPLEQVERSPRP